MIPLTASSKKEGTVSVKKGTTLEQEALARDMIEIRDRIISPDFLFSLNDISL